LLENRSTALISIIQSGRALALALTLALAIPATSHAQPDAGAFFRSIVGEWIGVCEQSTDGEKADNKYFHFAVTQVDQRSFRSEFKYYRFDEATQSPLHIGDTTIVSTIEPDGTVRNDISGQGTILVDEKPKSAQHQLMETLSCSGESTLTGQITGKISISGLLFGLGKNGEVHDAASNWTLDNGVLTIHQSLKAGFRILFFTKNFTVVAHSTARRGSDVVSLMTEAAQVAAGPTDRPS